MEDSHKGGPSSRLLSSINTGQIRSIVDYLFMIYQISDRVLRLLPFSYTSDAESGLRSSGASVAATAGHKKPSNMTQAKDGPGVFKVEGCT